MCFALSVFCSRGGRSQVRWCQVTVSQWSRGQQSSSRSSVIGHQGSFSGQGLWRPLRSVSHRQVWSRKKSIEQGFEQILNKVFHVSSYRFFCYGSLPFLNFSTAPYFQRPLSATFLSAINKCVLLAWILSTFSRRSFGFLRLLFSSFRAWFCVMV
jgi:hypothetical protein